MPVLVVVGGLPGSGKSTLAEAFARRRRVPFLRVDRIEQAVVDQTALTHPVGPVGYAVAHLLASEQLALGLDVVVECVNPLALTRDAWDATGAAAGARVVQVELVCSDVAEHRRRVETRATDVPGLVKPTWAEVVGRTYEPWPERHLVLDSSGADIGSLVDAVVAAVEAR
ncbi:AAA family ATPase [Microlunatus spumicola]|uniref:AAA family ATPase n=1 Tax=Microlunatus spumicola TaxID=81499 RepID=A0ABP6WVB4_9ACTN